MGRRYCWLGETISNTFLGSGPGRQRRLRLDVRSRHRLGAVQGLAHRQAAQTRQLGPRRRAQEVARRADEDEGALELC